MLKQLRIFLFVLSLLFFSSGRASAAFELQGSSSATGSANVAMPITDLQITGSGSEPIPVKLRVTNGSLAMSTTTGLTFNGSSTGSEIYFSGSLTNINTALATLTYTRSSTGSDTLEVSLVERGEVFFTENGHLYKFITGTINANNARTAAQGQTAYGASGYLATITSQAENDFVAARLQGDGWMGASDASVEGEWRWLDGPEANTLFWLGAANGSAQNGNYENWAGGEPNNAGNEDCAQFYITTGMWNDLPCSTSNLSGYVVEFGANGNMPTVAAKNVSLTTLNAPALSSVSPTDNAVSVSTTANLVLTFNRALTVDTGSITLRKTSDDSIVESIPVADARITGSGTTTITINPATALDELTSYYVLIPSTAFKDNSDIYYPGISNKTTWNFTTGDFTAPLLTNITTSNITDTAARITWTSNELSSTKINYGVTSSYGRTTTETDTSPRVLSHTVNLSNLLACTKYHYAVVSVDGSTNSTTTSDHNFTTTGCPAGEQPTATTTQTITTASGGSTSLVEDNKQLTVTTPSNFTQSASSVVIQIKALPNAAILENLGRPATLPNEIGTTVFDVTAIINGTTILDTFDTPITISYQYTDAEIKGLNESSLWLYHYHNNAWTALDNCSLNKVTKTISCTTDGFSIFGLFGKPNTDTHTAATSNSVDDGSCKQTPPGPKAPWIYAAVPESATSIRLYFAKGDDPTDHYALEFGTKSGQYQFGSLNIGNQELRTFLVESLLPNTKYYFRVRGDHGCAAGNWSNEIFANTRNLIANNQLTITQATIEPIKSSLNDTQKVTQNLDTETVTTSDSNYSVKIKVLDEKSIPISGAHLSLGSKAEIITTDENGFAYFEGIEPGHYKVTVAHKTYSGEQSLELSGETKDIQLTITVRQDSLAISPLAYLLLGLLVIIILILLLLLFKKKKKSSKN